MTPFRRPTWGSLGGETRATGNRKWEGIQGVGGLGQSKVITSGKACAAKKGPKVWPCGKRPQKENIVSNGGGGEGGVKN